MKRAAKDVGSTSNKNNPAIIQDVKKAIDGHRLFFYGARVVIGVSGGPDSMALLHILLSLRHELGLDLTVAHFNHRIRSNADKDEKFVREHAQELQLKVLCGKASSKPPSTGSLEDWARKERYRFFSKIAARTKADAVAVAHTADDLAETVLMRILRGAGLQGLVGMEAFRLIDGVPIIRPLLSVRKKDVQSYLKERKIPFCVDETNLKTDFLRNKVRLELLPYLAENYNPNIAQALVNLSKSSAEDYHFLETYSLSVWEKAAKAQKESVSLDLQRMRLLHPSVWRILIRMAYEQVKGDLSQLTFEHVLTVEKILSDPSGRTQLPTGIVVEKIKKTVVFSRSAKKRGSSASRI